MNDGSISEQEWIDCYVCMGAGYVLESRSVEVEGHAQGCVGETCPRTCPVPVEGEEQYEADCPECGGLGAIEMTK